MQKKQRGYEETKSRLDKLETRNATPEQIRGHQNGLYLDAVNVATYQLILNNSADAAQWFSRASHFSFECGETIVENSSDVSPSSVDHVAKKYAQGILTGCLSGEMNELEEIAVRTREREIIAGLVRDVEYVELQLLAATVLKQPDEVHEFGLRLSELAEKFDQYFTIFGPGQSSPVAEACESITESDLNRATEAISAILMAHSKRIDGQPRGQEEVMSLPAAGLVVLAHHFGLRVTIENQFLPRAIYDLVDPI